MAYILRVFLAIFVFLVVLFATLWLYGNFGRYVALLFNLFFCGLLSSLVAKNKKMNALLGFTIGFFGGLIGLAIVLVWNKS
jgi:hypothetical protein